MDPMYLVRYNFMVRVNSRSGTAPLYAPMPMEEVILFGIDDDQRAKDLFRERKEAILQQARARQQDLAYEPAPLKLIQIA